MADTITTYTEPSGASPTLKAYFFNNNSEIASTGEYVQGTGVTLTGASYADSTLDVTGDIFCGLVTATIDQIRVKEGATEVVRFDLAADEVFAAPTNFTYPWPAGGIEFAEPGEPATDNLETLILALGYMPITVLTATDEGPGPIVVDMETLNLLVSIIEANFITGNSPSVVTEDLETLGLLISLNKVYASGILRYKVNIDIDICMD